MSYNRNAIGSNEELVHNSSMARQAIINGNFDVWQRGTSLSVVDVTAQFSADHWRSYVDKDGGTLPTLTASKGTLTSGEIDGSFYYYRLTTDGAGSSLGASSQYQFGQRIEHGVRYLCGNGKKVTVRFKARSSISGKKIGIFLRVDYGSGGSPTSTEYISGTYWELSSSWTDYEYTFTTNTLSGKTFGTNIDDSLGFLFLLQWGATTGSTYLGYGTLEDYGGAGTIDIAQVQLCAGDIALPFEPKSYAEELRACLRYFWRCGNTGATCHTGSAVRCSTMAIIGTIRMPSVMRTSPTLTHSSPSWYSGGAPSGNQIGGIDLVANAYAAISGALSITIAWASPVIMRIDYGAGTSFSGSAGSTVTMVLGSTAYFDFSAEI